MGERCKLGTRQAKAQAERKHTSPVEAGTRLQRTSSIVLFPAPLGPMTELDKVSNPIAKAQQKAPLTSHEFTRLDLPADPSKNRRLPPFDGETNVVPNERSRDQRTVEAESLLGIPSR